MNTIEYFDVVDRSNWRSGPWDGEPDKVQWPDRSTGLPCLAVRNPSLGHWCGYVGVSEGHPMFGKDFEAPNVNVHGGLTYADLCRPGESQDRGICHLPGEGEPEHVWWFGFDCAHLGDLSPRMLFGVDDTYRDLEYVKRQCAKLARQLREYRDDREP